MVIFSKAKDKDESKMAKQVLKINQKQTVRPMRTEQEVH